MSVDGFSVIEEDSYVLGQAVKLPIFAFLKDDLKRRFFSVLSDYVEYCKQKKFMPTATTTWPYYVESVKKGADNLKKRQLMNLTILYVRAIRDSSKRCATPDPEVVFERVSDDGTVKSSVVKDTREALEARRQQGELKDLLMNRVAEDPRPVLDLGGGNDVTKKALEQRCVQKEVVNIDIRSNQIASFSELDLKKYESYQVLANHSLYHMSVTKALQVLAMRPRGITMVLDTTKDVASYKGDDYEFTAVRHPGLNDVEAYVVSGNIFAVRSRGSKGMLFKDELWFTRSQFNKWGFSLYADPSQQSSFVRRHVVLFDGNFTPTLSCVARHPNLVTMSEGRMRDHSRRVARLHELFVTSNRFEELRCYLGHWHYQTPKIDGINMKLFVDFSKAVLLVDKFGVTYNLVDRAGMDVYARDFISISFSVELLFKGDGLIQMYANQLLIRDRTVTSNDSLDELQKHVALFNGALRCEYLGLKDYVLNRNKIVSLVTDLPHDGVVYVSAYTRVSDGRSQVHCFHKPFVGTDTVMHVIATDSIHSINSARPFDVVFRDLETGAFVKENVFSASVKKLTLHATMNGSDFFGATTVTPLMYEGYYIPKEFSEMEKDAFLVTHVRGDKARKDVEVKIPISPFWASKGVIGLTRWGNCQKDVLDHFIWNLAPTRILKLLPNKVDANINFLNVFMECWSSGKDSNYDRLNKFVHDGLYESTVDEFLVEVRLFVPYNNCLSLLDTMFRYPSVGRRFYLQAGKIKTIIFFRVSGNYGIDSIDQGEISGFV